jgi:hypothetical protein
VAVRGATETNDRGLLKDARVYKRQKKKIAFFFIKEDLNYECVLPPSIVRSTHNPSQGKEDAGNIGHYFI